MRIIFFFEIIFFFRRAKVGRCEIFLSLNQQLYFIFCYSFFKRPPKMPSFVDGNNDTKCFGKKMIWFREIKLCAFLNKWRCIDVRMIFQILCYNTYEIYEYNELHVLVTFLKKKKKEKRLKHHNCIKRASI